MLNEDSEQLDYVTPKWRLSDFQKVEYDSINVLFTCLSACHGPSVLKIGYGVTETEREYSVLKTYQASLFFCKIYEADLKNGVMLLERIVPGTTLREESSLNQRLDVFCQVFEGLHVKPLVGDVYPTYLELVNKAITYMKQCENGEELVDYILHAGQLCRELSGYYPGEFLLHGDLHHDNILLDSDGTYRIIDPKGVIGDPVFDIGRFIVNEFDQVLDAEFDKKFNEIIETLSEKLKIPKGDLYQLVYIEICLMQSWYVEDGKEPDMEKVSYMNKRLDSMEGFELIGKGATANVYRDGEKAIKVYQSASLQRVEEEFRKQKLVYEKDLPVPEVYGIRTLYKHSVRLEMAYIEAQPLIVSGMTQVDARKGMETLVKLQCDVHKVEEYHLPEQTRILEKKIGKANLDLIVQDRLLVELSALDRGLRCLCHRDFHPLNVLYDGSSYWIIDWIDASSGDPLADACRSYLLIQEYNFELSEAYLATFCEITGHKKVEVLAWLPIQVAVRLSEQVSKETKTWLQSIVQEWYNVNK